MLHLPLCLCVVIVSYALFARRPFMLHRFRLSAATFRLKGKGRGKGNSTIKNDLTNQISQMVEAESSPPNSTPGDTGYTPGDDFATKWRNLFAALTGKMTDEGKAQFKLDRDIRNEKSDCDWCEKKRDWFLKYSTRSHLRP